MKYIKKPVPVEAFQLTEELALRYFIEKEPLPFGVMLAGSYHPGERKLFKAKATIQTPEGRVRADIGSWIIRGVRGETWVCNPDIFKEEYEAVDSDQPRLVALGDTVETTMPDGRITVCEVQTPAVCDLANQFIAGGEWRCRTANTGALTKNP